MYFKVLVEEDVKNGQRLVEALQKRMPVSAAFWFNVEDTNKWRLVIVSPLVGESGPRLAYDLLGQALTESQVPISPENISIVSPVNLRYKQVRLASQGVPSGITVGRNLTGIGFAGDAFVYVMN